MSAIVRGVPVMSSVELVRVINALRKREKKKLLRHDNFLAKIEKHPGIDAPKFLGAQKYGNGNTRKVYLLPKRECELMVMSESEVVQTRVYDRLTLLEGRAEERKLIRKDSKSSNRNMNGMLEMTREELGKSCASHHYSNEALMINEIVFGVRKAVDRDLLGATDLNRLIKMEMRNTLLIAKEKPYAERKELLKKFHEQMLLTPPPKPKMLKGKRA
jgi:hypothetical protein